MLFAGLMVHKTNTVVDQIYIGQPPRADVVQEGTVQFVKRDQCDELAPLEVSSVNDCRLTLLLYEIRIRGLEFFIREHGFGLRRLGSQP